MENKKYITVLININSAAEKVWEYWTNPRHIEKWNAASEDWHTPRAENDIRPEGRFLWRMEAKDGSFGFDFTGQYTEVIRGKYISYTMDDTRCVEITFEESEGVVIVTEKFEPEKTNSEELQRMGWQAILDNFKKYVENN